MKIAIIGYGKMGRTIERLAIHQGHGIAAIVDPFVNKAFNGTQISKSLDEADLSGVDAAIEFTRPDTAVENMIALAQKKIPTVAGTTAWHDRMGEVTRAVKDEGSSLIWSSNFSIGVNLFYRVAWFAAKLVNQFPEYDVGGFESHHNEKTDSPSGTARVLAEGVLALIDRKERIVWNTMKQKPDPAELHFPSLRIGAAPGQHSLFFDSAADTIEITHVARNREGLAMGAIRAALWLTAEKRTGVFTIDDMLENMLKGYL